MTISYTPQITQGRDPVLQVHVEGDWYTIKPLYIEDPDDMFNEMLEKFCKETDGLPPQNQPKQPRRRHFTRR